MKEFNIKNFKGYNLKDSLMLYRPQNELQYIYEDEIVLNIANNTKNTWQSNRPFEEILDNTVQGKVVEDMLESYINEKIDGIMYFSYDSFRKDDYSKHAPFDGFIYKDGNPFLGEAIEKVSLEVKNNNFGKISDNLFKWLSDHQIYTMEIKSSKVPKNDYPTNSNIEFNTWEYQNKIIDSLRKRDYFVYPKYKRTGGKGIHNFSDYVEHVKGLGVSFEDDFTEALLNEERNAKCDIYTRVFVDRTSSNIFVAYILGYTQKDSFFNNPQIINMPGNKSGNAIYFAYPISESNSIDKLNKDISLW